MDKILDLENEVWKAIEGFDDYLISSMGRVKSLKYNKERILKGLKDTDGYLQVYLYSANKPRMRKVHRLVATAFLENPLNLPQVNHKNEIPSDNRLENLEWCDCKYNLTYNDGAKKRAETKKKSAAWKETMARVNAKKRKQVYQYTTDKVFVEVYASTTSAAAANNLSQSTISACCLEKIKSAGGYIFSYEPLPTLSNQLSLFPTTKKEKKIS